MTTTNAGLTKRGAESFFERHAWKVLLCISAVIGFFGAGDVIGSASNLQFGEAALMHSLAGTSWLELQAASPGAANLIDWKFRSEGGTLLALGVLLIAVCLTGFRRGERWAWYTLLTVPLWLALGIASLWRAIRYSGYGTPVPVISGAVFFVLWVGMLALSHRKFFHLRG